MSSFEITTSLKIDDQIIVEEITMMIDARFREFMNASADHDFELEDWDLMGVQFETEDGEVWIEYPDRNSWTREKRNHVAKQLEALRVFVPMTNAEIETTLLAQYAKERT